MKITEPQLKKIIKEEIDQMIDEGAWDFVKGIGSKVGGDVASGARKAGSAVAGAGKAVKKYGKGVARAGKLRSLGADMKKVVSINNQLLKRLKILLKDAPNLNPEVQEEVEDFEAGVSAMDFIQAQIIGPDASRLSAPGRGWDKSRFRKGITERNKRKKK